MTSILTKLSEKPFIRNVAIVATGTVAAQVVSMAFAPIISRIYGPDAFGVMGVFMAIVGIITPIAALTYPIAIILPKSDQDAKGLIYISLYISGVMATLTTLILVFFSKSIVNLLQIDDIAIYLYLLPLIILFSTFLQVTQQWLIRTKQFRTTAIVAFINALILNCAKSGIGWFNPVAAVLVVLTAFGSALHALMLVIGINHSKLKTDTEQPKSKVLKEISKKYIDFPLFRAPQVLINAISQSLPILLLASFFGPVSAGFYSISLTVLGMPTSLIGKAVGDVFYPRLVDASNNGEYLTSLIIKVTMTLALVGIIPFGIVVAFGPGLFGFIFGPDWVSAGEYARWLAIWLFFGFINRPSVVAVSVLRLQGILLIYETFSTTSKVIALVIGFYLVEREEFTIALYSIVGAVAYLFLILWVISSSRKYKGNLDQ